MPTGGKRKKGDRVMRKTLPMNLQFFAEGGDGNGDQNAGSNNNGQAGQQSGQNNQQTAGVDYDKIQAMLDNATAKKENAVLKSYFQQQGLSEDEISQAIATFKQNKQQNSSRTLMLIFRMKWQLHRRLLNRLRLSLQLQR